MNKEDITLIMNFIKGIINHKSNDYVITDNDLTVLNSDLYFAVNKLKMKFGGGMVGELNKFKNDYVEMKGGKDNKPRSESSSDLQKKELPKGLFKEMKDKLKKATIDKITKVIETQVNKYGPEMKAEFGKISSEIVNIGLKDLQEIIADIAKNPPKNQRDVQNLIQKIAAKERKSAEKFAQKNINRASLAAQNIPSKLVGYSGKVIHTTQQQEQTTEAKRAQTGKQLVQVEPLTKQKETKLHTQTKQEELLADQNKQQVELTEQYAEQEKQQVEKTEQKKEQSTINENRMKILKLTETMLSEPNPEAYIKSIFCEQKGGDNQSSDSYSDIDIQFT